MPREKIRDFSGGLVTYQSEFDISSNQFQQFENLINTKRGSVTKMTQSTDASAALSGGINVNSELLRYRTEKDASGNDISTEWWVVGNALVTARQATATGTGGSFTTINTYAVGSECVAGGDFGGGGIWSVGTGWTVNPELITNTQDRDISTGTINWVKYDPATTGFSGYVEDTSTDDRIEITGTSSTEKQGAELGTSYFSALTVGKNYRVSAKIYSASGSISGFKVDLGGVSSTSFAISTSTTAITKDFTAASDSALRIYYEDASTTQWFIDDISIVDLAGKYADTGNGTIGQSNSAMTIPLEADNYYKLVFTISNLVGGAGKAMIAIANSANTEDYKAIASYGAATHTVYFTPQTGSSGIAFYSTTAGDAYVLDDVSVKAVPKYDFLAHNQILRISDGTFNSSNNSIWYGHIKRDVFGQAQTYTDGYKFRKPPMAATINAWKAKNTILTPPTVVAMKYAFDQNDDINAVNEVGIFVHYPADSGNDIALIPDADDNTFSGKDKYTVTFLYDHIQESELGRDANNDIGVPALNTTVDTGANCPGIQLVVYTGASLASWNERITGINLYWNPADDIDWYLVGTYDVGDCFSDDPRAKDSSTEVVLRLGTATTNNGYWIPCMEPYGATANSYENINASTASTFTESDGGSSWGSVFVANNMVFVYPDNTITSLADVSGKLKETSTIIANIKSVSGTTLTTGIGSGATVNWKNWSGEGHSETPFSMSSARAFTATVSTDKVATWYLPNDGLKLSTYASLTGRASETRLKEIKWNTSTTVRNKAFYANIDFEDNNEQTIREKNRIVYTDDFKLDETQVGTHFIDVGLNDGDMITAMTSLQDRLFVLKERNVYVYRVAGGSNFALEQHIAGIGCLHKHAYTFTPAGLCFADKKQVSLLSEGKVTELSFSIRDTYQALGFDPGSGGMSLGYDSIMNTLFVSYDSTSEELYSFNFDTRSWSKTDVSNLEGIQSNMVLDSSMRTQLYDTDSDKVENVASGSTTTTTLAIKTKRYDFGLPEQFKRFTKLHLIYLSGTNVTVNIHIDGNSSIDLALTFANNTTLGVDSQRINLLGRSIEIQVTATNANTRIEGIDLEYDLEGANP